MGQQGWGATEQPSGEILAQLAALTALVQAQGEKIQVQGDEIARLRTAPAGSAVHTPASVGDVVRTVTDGAPSRLGRRGWVRTMIGATAAAALLTMAKEAPKAEAYARGHVVDREEMTDVYGLLAAWGTSDPEGSLGAVIGNFDNFGVIGINLFPGFTAPSSAGVLGTGGATGGAGILGMAQFGPGAHGISSNGTGVAGESRGSATGARGVYGLASATSGITVGTWGESRSTTHLTRGVYGTADGASGTTVGVWGRSVSPTGRGVYGENMATAGTTSGVYGEIASTSDAAAAVNGVSQGVSGQTYGVRGTTFSNTPNSGGVKGEAVFGVTNAVWGENFSSAESATGVFGLANAPGGNTIGVLGRSNSPSNNAVGVYGQVPAANAAGIGVRGDSPAGVGVYAASNTGRGVVAQTTSGNAVVGVTAANNVAAILGVNSGGLAARFVGNVIVQGGATVTGPKSAAVKKRDGTHVRMYCQESPEPWFEDFGTAELKNGQASVALDPEFDEVVKGDDYRVFLTPIGVECSLYVSRKGPHRFEVRSVGGTAKDGSFDYRVVARRADPVGGRLEKVTIPAPIDDKSLVPDAARAERPAPARAEPPKPERTGRPEALPPVNKP
jgi:hypothetical protein